MTFESKYGIGHIVYLITDHEQSEWIITSVVFAPSGITYNLSRGSEEYGAFEMEITDMRNVIKAMGV